MDLKKERVDVHQIILDSVRHHTMALQERNGIVDSQLTATQFNIEADKYHLTSVFNNLIDNAIKYCKEISSHHHSYLKSGYGMSD